MCEIPSRKIAGLCTKCGAEIFAVVSRYTEGPRRGEPRELGPPMPGARRLIVVRMSGSTCFWSVCSECQVTAEDMPKIRAAELSAMARERDFVRHNRKQLAFQERMLNLFIYDAPLGVLGEIPWVEVR